MTATTYSTLLDDAIIDRGPGSNVPVERVFFEWRDLSALVPTLESIAAPATQRRFLTWLTYWD